MQKTLDGVIVSKSNDVACCSGIDYEMARLSGLPLGVPSFGSLYDRSCGATVAFTHWRSASRKKSTEIFMVAKLCHLNR